MVIVEKGIKVEDFIELIKPFSNMEITFSKTNEGIGTDNNCTCNLNLAGEVGKLKLELKIIS